MPNRTTGYTPFFMVYGAEAVFPYDIIHDSPRVRMYEEREREAELDRQDSQDALHYKKRHIRDILGQTNFFPVIHMTLL